MCTDYTVPDWLSRGVSLPALQAPAGTVMAVDSMSFEYWDAVKHPDQLPIAADGSITYEAVANAVKGRVPH